MRAAGFRRGAAPVLAAAAAAVVAAAAAGTPVPRAAAQGPRTVTLSVVGTNDLHGRIASLPVLGGYLANLRRARDADSGGVVLVDAGDMFQGTLESNLGEGAAVVRAYNTLGYTAAAVGNHEFDFGPVGPAATPSAPADDPQGALKARAREAKFPLLAANLRDAATGAAPAWPNVRPSALVTVAGVKVGIIGVTTAGTLRATIAANVRGLAVTPLATAVTEEARKLRAAGAVAVIVAAHAGGSCTSWSDPDDLSSCRAGSEIFELVQALPARLVDVVVAGHTHDRIAHRVSGVAVIESGANGRLFGRVDLTVDPAARQVRRARIFPPEPLCADGDGATCRPAAASYEGRTVVADAATAAHVAAAVERAHGLRELPLGVQVVTAVRTSYREEAPLGNLFTDLMRAARPGTDVAVLTGGGLRADLPAGPLTYGKLYETFPFDNRFARLRLTGAELQRMLRVNLGAGGGILSLSGLRAAAACAGRSLEVSLAREDGRAIAADETLTVLTTDFLATGGDELFGDGAPELENGPPLRDALADLLRARRGTLDGRDPAVFDPGRPRLRLPGPRPIRCGDARAPAAVRAGGGDVPPPSRRGQTPPR
jgi:5'-nucleotidase